MSFFEKIRMLGGVLGCLLQILIWGGGIGIHTLAGIIVWFKHGIIWGFIAFGLPVVSTIYVIFITIFSGVWWYAGLVVAYVVTLIVSVFLIAQAEEL